MVDTSDRVAVIRQISLWSMIVNRLPNTREHTATSGRLRPPVWSTWFQRCSRWAVPYFTLLGVAALQAPGQDAIHTNQDLFLIPFTIKPASTEDPRSLQAVLYVSGDRGANWHNYQTQPIDGGKFSFRAGADGEFWFAVRTKVGPQALELPQDLVAELRVIVDRQPPTVDFTATHEPSSAIRLAWRTSDEIGALGKIRFEARSATTGAWTPVVLPGPPLMATGSVTWQYPATSPPLAVRAIVTDQAGNETITEREIANPHVAPNRTPYQRLDPGQAPVDPPAFLPGQSATTEVQITERRPSSEGTEGTPETGITIPNAGGAATVMPSPESMMPGPQSADSTWTPSPAPTPPAPDSGVTRASRSRKFQLDYVIENDTVDGVHRVEVWYTTDNGQNWMHYGDDEDRQSPMVAEVPNDGLYGFRLLVQSREGLVAAPPRSGDTPDVWVRVDATPPVAKITAARFGRGQDAAVLEIQWEARDAALESNPITLQFGESPTGPWRKVASHLPNSGEYDWRYDDRVPALFYLRLEVVDTAGNAAVDILTTPIRRDGFAPQGRIRAVRPVGFPWQRR